MKDYHRCHKPGALLLITWFEFNCNMDKWIHTLWNVGWSYIFIPKPQRCNRWSLGMDKWFHPKLYWVCDYLSTLGLQSNHLKKTIGPRTRLINGRHESLLTRSKCQKNMNGLGIHLPKKLTKTYLKIMTISLGWFCIFSHFENSGIILMVFDHISAIDGFDDHSGVA